MEKTELLNIKETCQLLGVKESWIRSAIFKGRIPIIKLGRFIRFSKEDLNKWLETQKRRPKNEAI